MNVTAALQPVVEALERLGIAYHVGGSVASSVHGSPRATNDVDLVVDLRLEHVGPLCASLGADYYAPAELLREAVVHASTANLIHLATGYKVDFFVCRRDEYGRGSLRRFLDRPLGPGQRSFHIATAEDIVLRKLEWYRDGGEVSDRPWSDVLGVLRARGPQLDRSYLDRWAQHLGITPLLARAMRESNPA